jgi:membrane fusion protein (multidrug efflux system)
MIKNACLLILILTLSSACDEENGAALNGAKENNTLEADYYLAKPQLLENSLTTVGTLIPGEQAMLSAQVAGKVVSISFDEGSEVPEGKLLVRLDNRQWLAQKANLESQLETSDKNLERKNKLIDISGISQEALDEAKVNNASLKAQLNEIEVMLDHTTIRAPFSGKTGLRKVSVGSYLSAGDPVTSIAQLNPLKLEFSVPERYAGQIKNGQTITFNVEGLDSTFTGKVYASEPSINEASRALKIRARVDNKARKIIPGAFADVELELESVPDAIMIPTEAIVPQLNEQIVYRFKNGKAEGVTVKTGVRQPRLIQIEKGLNPGDTIIVSGLLQIKEGMPVKAGERVKVEEETDKQ